MMRHYIFLASSEDYLKVAYGDIVNLEGVRYQTEYLYHPTKLLRYMHLAHCCIPIAKKVKFPFRSIWYSQYYKEKYVQGDEYVFIFFTNWIDICNQGYLTYLRKKYPGCKCVLFLQDVNNARKLDMNFEKKIFDHIMIFEKNFAIEKGIEYYPLVYSEGLKEVQYPERPIDLLFVGGAKGRYGFLKQVYQRLTKEGLNCQIFVSNMDEQPDEKDNGIHIVEHVAYEENIRMLKQAKCVLDVVPPNTNCNTLRMCEAMFYETKILTNNQYVKDEAYFNPELISTYTTAEDIDIDFLKKPYQSVDYQYKEKISPNAFLRHLDSVLFEKP